MTSTNVPLPAFLKSRETLALVGFGRAVRLRSAVEATEEILLDGPLDVVADEEIGVTVAVVVDEGGTRGEAGIAHARFRGHVDEGPVARVPEESVGTQGGDVEIVPSVAVVVRHGHAETVDLDAETGRRL